jgi:uncharacterized protein YbjT (DUF2867 family)
MIVVTAPSGLIGGQVVEHLLAAGAAVRVIAREPLRLPSEWRDRVDVVQGSHAEANVLEQTFAGAEAVFWLVPPDPSAPSVAAAYVDFSRPAVQCFGKMGIKRVVGISALGRGTPQAVHAGYVTGSLAMDDLIATSGAAYRAVTNPSFMDNLLRQVNAIKNKGMFFSPIAGDKKFPTCATRDIAQVSAKLLLDTTWSDIGHAAVLGPEDLSFDDMALIMSDVLDRPIRFQQTTFEAYKAQFLSFGMSDAMAQGMTDMAAAKNDGLDNAEPRTDQNTTPTSFYQWCEEVLKPAVLALPTGE